MEWEPEEQAWHSYINFELRYKELDRARGIYERYILYYQHFVCAAQFGDDALNVSVWFFPVHHL